MKTNINLTTYQIERLMNLIVSKGFVYEYADELMNVADKENLAELSEQLRSANYINIVSKDDIQDNGFYELVDWSTKNDILIMVNQNLLVCIPKEEYKKIA